MRTTEALDTLAGSQYADAATLLSTARCLGWSEERLIAALKALLDANHFANLRDENFS